MRHQKNWLPKECHITMFGYDGGKAAARLPHYCAMRQRQWTVIHLFVRPLQKALVIKPPEKPVLPLPKSIKNNWTFNCKEI